MKRWGLPEYLGIVVALVCFAWWSPVNDYLAGPKLLILLAGGLGAIPAVIYRWRAGQAPRGAARFVIAAALGLIAWATLSMLLSGAPLATSLLGWWGRANGWLSLVGAGALMLAAATLRRDEIPRVITWLLVGATAISLVGVAQLGGNQVVGGLPDSSLIATMGNINFSGAYFAIMSILAAGRALTAQAPSWQRIWAGALTAVLIALSILSTSAQGPAAIGAGALAMLVLWALAYHGDRRRIVLGSAGALATVSVATVLVSFAGIGPLAGLWQDANFRVRQGTWLTAWDIAQAMPVFGTGPDGLQRFANQYSPDFYVELVGTRITLSAAHNVPLQYAATLGILAGLLWMIAMVGAIVLLLVTMARHRIQDAVVAASVGGAFVGYLTQAMVSIDMTGLLATGWLLLGLTLALCLPRTTPEPPPDAAPEQTRKQEDDPKTDLEPQPAEAPIAAAGASEVTESQPATVARRTSTTSRAPTKPKGKSKGKGGNRPPKASSGRGTSSTSRPKAASRQQRGATKPRWTMATPVWVPITGVILGGLGATVVGQSILIDSRTAGAITAETLVELLESPWTPCASRIPLVQVAVRDLPPEQSVPATYAAADIDPRCDTITAFQAELAIQNNQVDIAARATEDAITFNPDNNISWILRARYHLLVGDLAAAQADYVIAADLTERFPGNEQGQESLDRLRADLDAAQAAQG